MNYTQMKCKASNAVFDMIPSFEGSIYHYCPDEAAKGIIINSTLRFTDRRFQTDPDEAVFPLTVCSDNVDKLIDIAYFNDLAVGIKFLDCFKMECESRIKMPYSKGFYTFQSCYSTAYKFDSLWREFARDGGYRFEFYSKDLLNKLRLRNRDSEQRIMHGLVIYDESKQVALMKDLIDKFLTPDFYMYIERDYKRLDRPTLHELIIDRIMLLGTFMVKPRYRKELEYKIVLDLHKDSVESEFSTIYNEQKTFKRCSYSKPIPYGDVDFVPCALKGVTVEKDEELAERKQSLLHWGENHFTDVWDKINIEADKCAFS